MSKVVIADSPCLIALSRIGRLGILQALFGNVLIPPAVHDEVVIKGEGQPGAKDVAACSWIKIQNVKNQLAVRALRSALGPGESEAIILAAEMNADFLILDDKKARIQAQELLLPVIGTVAVIQKAVDKHLASDLPSILKELASAGFRYKVG
jgi:predicted nucleic acid-binding protein